jgi:cytochrome P450
MHPKAETGISGYISSTNDTASGPSTPSPYPLFICNLGPIIRFTPNAVSINTAAALQDIYGSRKANVVKSDWYRTIQYAEKGTASTFTAINPKQHAQKRRLLSHAFSESALRDMEPRVVDHVQKWCNHLGERPRKGDWSGGRNMSTWADYLTFDVLSDLSFGKSLEITEKEDNRFVMDLLLNSTHAAYDVCKDSAGLYNSSLTSFWTAWLPPLRFIPPQATIPDPLWGPSRRPAGS